MSDEKTGSYNMPRLIVKRVDSLIDSGATYATTRSGWFRATVEGQLRVADSLSSSTIAHKWAEKQLYIELIQKAAPWRLKNTVQAMGGVERLLTIHDDVQARERDDVRHLLRQALHLQYKIPANAFDRMPGPQ